MQKQTEEEEKNSDGKQKKSSVVIRIPSYQEVVESSQAKSTPPSLFLPSQSFSQAFAFVKSSEFYDAPPPPPEPRETAQSDAPSSTSTPSPAAASAASSSKLHSSQASQNRNSILVSHRQKGNPLLKHIRNVRWAFADVVCDYMLGQSSCALYLRLFSLLNLDVLEFVCCALAVVSVNAMKMHIKSSINTGYPDARPVLLRYHLLHPDYLYYRIRELQKNFKLRVVLCHVDVEDVIKPLLEVTKTALLHDCTLLCGWSLEECGRYLETIKVYENKPADIIQGQMDTDYLSRLTHALTTVRHVNKTDVVTLGTTFGSLSNIMGASMEDLARCPGIGERKVKRLFDTFHEPFKRVDSSRQAIPDTSVQYEPASPGSLIRNHTESSSLIEDKQGDVDDVSKRRKKEPEVTVKSALSAAFAKYSDRVGKRKETSQVEEKGE
ncbi:hypothetical protein V8G54_029719 [Vigna mungo]|uniref:ERCC1-like central domain-containing protein n=1 Tax=Vigna mungo TaxID=3915 RepID=A0AAQ3MV73_VIGMU